MEGARCVWLEYGASRDLALRVLLDAIAKSRGDRKCVARGLVLRVVNLRALRSPLSAHTLSTSRVAS